MEDSNDLLGKEDLGFEDQFLQNMHLTSKDSAKGPKSSYDIFCENIQNYYEHAKFSKDDLIDYIRQNWLNDQYNIQHQFFAEIQDIIKPARDRKVTPNKTPPPVLEKMNSVGLIEVFDSEKNVLCSGTGIFIEKNKVLTSKHIFDNTRAVSAAISLPTTSVILSLDFKTIDNYAEYFSDVVTICSCENLSEDFNEVLFSSSWDGMCYFIGFSKATNLKYSAGGVDFDITSIPPRLNHENLILREDKAYYSVTEYCYDENTNTKRYGLVLLSASNNDGKDVVKGNEFKLIEKKHRLLSCASREHYAKYSWYELESLYKEKLQATEQGATIKKARGGDITFVRFEDGNYYRLLTKDPVMFSAPLKTTNHMLVTLETSPGASGGAYLDNNGKIIAIHCGKLSDELNKIFGIHPKYSLHLALIPGVPLVNKFLLKLVKFENLTLSIALEKSIVVLKDSGPYGCIIDLKKVINDDSNLVGLNIDLLRVPDFEKETIDLSVVKGKTKISYLNNYYEAPLSYQFSSTKSIIPEFLEKVSQHRDNTCVIYSSAVENEINRNIFLKNYKSQPTIIEIVSRYTPVREDFACILREVVDITVYHKSFNIKGNYLGTIFFLNCPDYKIILAHGQHKERASYRLTYIHSDFEAIFDKDKYKSNLFFKKVNNERVITLGGQNCFEMK